MQPIWNYIARAKNAQKPKGAQQALKKTDNTMTQNKTELIARWTEWVKTTISKHSRTRDTKTHGNPRNKMGPDRTDKSKSP